MSLHSAVQLLLRRYDISLTQLVGLLNRQLKKPVKEAELKSAELSKPVLAAIAKLLKAGICQLNQQRLTYLLKQYKLSKDELLDKLNDGRKRQWTREELEIKLFSDLVELSDLKRVDKIFEQGIYFYVNPAKLEATATNSIFFRKSTFTKQLSFETCKVIDKLEKKQRQLSTLAKLTGLTFTRELLTYTTNDKAETVAKEIRKNLYPAVSKKDPKIFFKDLIAKLADAQLLVLEYIDRSRIATKKFDVDGLFIQPNFIVINRRKNWIKRELFTLAHELGHYLLDNEEIEEVDDWELSAGGTSVEEKWCDEFAYHFLAGNSDAELMEAGRATAANHYHTKLIAKLSEQTHLSKLALYTRLLHIKQISKQGYGSIRQKQIATIRAKEKREAEERAEQQAAAELAGKPLPLIFSAKPIRSPLQELIVREAFYGGVIDEIRVCEVLNIKMDKLPKYV